MSAWREREPPAEPLVGALAQLCHIAAGIGNARSSTPFAECLQQLQALHEQQVAALTGEARRLRKEVDALRKEAGVRALTPLTANGDHSEVGERALTPLTEYGDHPGVRSGNPLGMRVVTPQAASGDLSECGLQRGEAGEAAEEEGMELSLTDRPKVTQAKSLSRAVSKTIHSHLETFRSCGASSEGSAAKARVSARGTLLLDEYTAYRRLSSGGVDSDGCVKKVVSSPNFDVVMGAIIAVNAVTIGLEASMNRAGQDLPLVLHISEYVFLFLYTVELGLRLGALGYRALCNAWVQFDFLLVCCGFLDLGMSFFGPPVELLDNVMLVRTLRLARLARVLRLMIKFHTLWMLVQGLLHSLMTLTWTCIIICILLFVFAVLGLELLQPDPSADDEYNQVASENFGSLTKAVTSLLQGLTLDNFGLVYRPVMLAKPLTVFYFVPFILVVSIALMNLVTALMVNFSLDQAAKDRQAEEQAVQRQKAEVVRILEAAFRELDTDQSGQIDLMDMLAAPEELRTLICEVADVGQEEADLVALFKTLDFEKCGYVKIEDFCQGLLMFHNQRALESYFVMKFFSSSVRTLKRRRGSSDVGCRGSVGTVSSLTGDDSSPFT